MAMYSWLAELVFANISLNSLGTRTMLRTPPKKIYPKYSEDMYRNAFHSRTASHTDGTNVHRLIAGYVILCTVR